MQTKDALDKLDRSILRCLQANGRETYDVIGEQVGLSPSAVLRRVKRLEEAGVIDRYVALVKPESVGLGLTGEMDCLLRVVVADMAHYSRFIMETLLKHPSVQDCKTSFVLDHVKATTAVPV